ncbi:hypothetical protein JZ751_027571 [Albula glossodonta]|uniref:2-oxo-4-hydroxy-4-carboxy-5-ureidoimidazoline decarboxylase n=1 Tax=Albula glossodonta TaxID=121402 RepID=A0A8T2MNN0_9TELE|nr:hypothetical protein JZ751_027571 [Albula glossodonta]
MDIAVVNSLSYEQFVEVFGNAVEKCPLVAAAVWSSRPFTSIADIDDAFGHFIDSLPDSGKEGVLRCHPDLAGRDLQSGTLTADSLAEQSQAGLTQLGVAEAERIAVLNSQYKLRFGFPFVICARMNDKTSILQQLSQRLASDHAHELTHAIGEVKRICSLRLQALVCPTHLGPAQPNHVPPRL